MSVQSVGVQSIPDAVVEGGRSLASPAHSVGVRPGAERPMSVQSVGVQSIPDAVVEGGRSLASPAHSVGVRPGDERPMIEKRLVGLSPCDPEEDDWCWPPRKPEWRYALECAALDRIVEMNDWCLPPRRTEFMRCPEVKMAHSDETVVVGGNPVMNNSKASHPSFSDVPGPVARDVPYPELQESATSTSKMASLNEGNEVPVPVIHAVDWEPPKSPLFADAGNPVERWLDVPTATPTDKKHWRHSQNVALSRSSGAAQQLFPVLEDLDLLKRSSNLPPEEVEREMMPSVMGSDAHAPSDSNASRSRLDVRDTQQLLLNPRGSEVSGEAKEPVAMSDKKESEEQAPPTGDKREVMPLRNTIEPWSVQESPYALEVFEVSVPDLSEAGGVDFWLENESPKMFSKLLRDLEEAGRVIRKPVELLRKLRESEEDPYWDKF
ncbi:uncharacterized protein Tco025E_08016 [Trypanosoma conorhini]|uniref:Uncharacterized protein n=1 Tax=Trypanosoma conorhini TaxID=83891 RepID=A0A422NF98_9TRYP|nr:uncharacterized protein Tco025E_08016 [Trypanosoma conorhini]RNF04141.1 hypothetical protein Tco025E_08016 [Trypanosoma conorhini]